MNRLTKVESSSVLIKDGWKKKDTESYTSICYGCEEIGRCVNKCGFYKALEKLADYEDLEEQGLLIKLPCKEKDTIYILDGKGNIHECEVYNITTNIYANTDKKSVYWKGFEIKDNLFGKTVFLTKEEAEKAMEEMKI